jgi:hypothetical protein
MILISSIWIHQRPSQPVMAPIQRPASRERSMSTHHYQGFLKFHQVSKHFRKLSSTEIKGNHRNQKSTKIWSRKTIFSNSSRSVNNVYFKTKRYRDNISSYKSQKTQRALSPQNPNSLSRTNLFKTHETKKCRSS